MKTYVHAKACTYSAALFIITESGNYPNAYQLVSGQIEYGIQKQQNTTQQYKWNELSMLPHGRDSKYYANLKTPEQKTTYFMSQFCREKSVVPWGWDKTED